jgi:ABC-type hemin transport system ATPase subunit
MSAVLQADAVVVGDPPSQPVSLALGRGEILGLLFPEGAPRRPMLRALAGLDSPRSGEVRLAGTRRIVLVSPGSSSAEAFAVPADVVFLDGLADVQDGRAERAAWARLAAERECGTAIVLATGDARQAYRSDRVVLAMRTTTDVTRALLQLSRRMQLLVGEVVRLLDAPKGTANPALAAELRRLARGSGELLAAARALARDKEERLYVEEVSAELASVSLDDRVLDLITPGDD